MSLIVVIKGPDATAGSICIAFKKIGNTVPIKLDNVIATNRLPEIIDVTFNASKILKVSDTIVCCLIDK